MNLPFPPRGKCNADTWTVGDRTRKYSLVVACFRAYSSAFFSAVLPRLCLTGFTFAQPFMINTLTEWIQDKDAPDSSGKGMIGAYGFIYLGMAVNHTPMKLRLLGEPVAMLLFDLLLTPSLAVGYSSVLVPNFPLPHPSSRWFDLISLSTDSTNQIH